MFEDRVRNFKQIKALFNFTLILYSIKLPKILNFQCTWHKINKYCFSYKFLEVTLDNELVTYFK